MQEQHGTTHTQAHTVSSFSLKIGTHFDGRDLVGEDEGPNSCLQSNGVIGRAHMKHLKQQNMAL